MNPLKIVYIAGYSRSGSTILDILLGNSQGVYSTGELGYLPFDYHSNRLCSCGEKYGNCSFWKDLGYSVFELKELVQIVKKIESRTNYRKLANNDIEPKDLNKYKEYQRQLFTYISQKSSCSTIIDSSKNARDMAGRTLALVKTGLFDLRVIHLTKSCEEVMLSYKNKGSNWALEGHGKNKPLRVQRAALGWKLANNIASDLQNSPGCRYIRLKYEDFIDDPMRTIQVISQFIDHDLTDLSENLAAGGDFKVSHNVGGNRLRLNQSIKLKKPSQTKIKLSLVDRITHNLIASSTARQLGY